MKKMLLTMLLFLASFMHDARADATLHNYIGTESDGIRLTLSATNGSYGSPTIYYQGLGYLPHFNDPQQVAWSSWNVNDSAGNYYGTISLNSNSYTASWASFAPSTTGYSLDTITLVDAGVDATGAHTYNLSVKSLIKPSEPEPDAGPFPDAPLATPAYDSNGQKITFAVEGNHIIDNNGKNVVFKGLARPSLEWNPQGQYLTVDEIKLMHEKWGANVLRLDLNQDYWLSSAGAETKGSYKQIVNALVYYATQNNMAVIFDLHWIDDNKKQQPMADANSITFWQYVAWDYKDFGTVLFELYNEPYGIDATTWLNGNTAAGYIGYQRLYDEVRSRSTNICIINGLEYGYDLSFVNDDFKVAGTNIVYGSHPYKRTMTELNSNFPGVLDKYPLIFTEFGDNDDNHYPSSTNPNTDTYASYYADVLSFANLHGVNYTGFAWWAGNPGFPSLISNFTTGDAINGGKQIQLDMTTAATAGTALDFSEVN